MKEKQAEQKQKHRRLFALHLTNIVESFPFIILIFLISFTLGGAIFINVPEGVGCDRDNVLCQKLRLRQPKVFY